MPSAAGDWLCHASAGGQYATLPGGGGETGRAGDAGATVAAVSHRILRQVLLMITLGVVELRGVEDLGGDAAVPGGAQHALVGVAGRLGEPPLLGRVHIDAGTVLRADVVALPHALGGVVALPENLQEALVRDGLRIEHHEDDLVVARAAC